MTTSSKKILVVGPSWVGDMVMAQTLFMLLKQQDPFTQIDVLAPEWSRPLLERMPEVSRSLVMPIGHGQLRLGDRLQLGKKLQKEQYQQAIVLPNSWKSALIPFWANIPLRTGWLGEFRVGVLNDFRKLDCERLPLMIERFMALGISKHAKLPQQLPKPLLLTNQENIDIAVKRYGLTQGQQILALCPGAEYGPAKRWPTSYFADIAKRGIAKGFEVWLFGAAKDAVIAAEIQQLTQNACVDLTGKTTLGDAIDLLSLATVVVTNDSGLMHISAALKKPLVVIYGSSDPRFTPPLAEQVATLSLGLDCSPCFERECPLGHTKCLNDLHPDQVWLAIDKFITS